MICGALVLAANVAMIYLATQSDDVIVDSYLTEER
jgi:hypothetical protein